jgi:hypothetical protein
MPAFPRYYSKLNARNRQVSTYPPGRRSQQTMQLWTSASALTLTTVLSKGHGALSQFSNVFLVSLTHAQTGQPSNTFQLWNSGKSRRFLIRMDPVVSTNLAPGLYLHLQRMPTSSRPQVLGSTISSLTFRACHLTRTSSTSPLSRFGWPTASRR